jgi:hypothetical protein
METVLVLGRLDEPTLDWFHGQRRVLAAAGVVDEAPRDVEASRAFLAARPEAVLEPDGDGEFVPILHRWLGEQAESLERGLIAAGAIAAVGFRRC